jgi:prepilin signal peptidase PulO-like enzyme (type II secretory pathway)
VNAILAMPWEVRLAVLFVLGACLGSLVNLAVDRLAWHPRRINPWSAGTAGAPPRRLADRLPIFGWLGLRRESPLHGAGFWIRPMLTELLCGAGLAALYWWEIDCAGLLPPGLPRPLPPNWMVVLHAQYAAHVVLIFLMITAALIDAAEKIIPDALTVPGTLLGLLLAAACPSSILPDVIPGVAGQFFLQPLLLTSPNAWPAALSGYPQTGPLWAGLVGWGLWCAALLPWTWFARHGWRRAVQLCCARLVRRRATYAILLMGLLGSAVIAAVWRCGTEGWAGLLSALTGMVFSGGLVWAVRIIGTTTLGREAMGFGDVTLMAMIGAFLGWQACLMVFFIAPLAGLVVGLLRLILLRDSEIPYGPFLCLAAVVVIVRWAGLWDWASGIFALGWLVPLIVVMCLALMAVLLSLMRLVRAVLLR